MKFLRFAAGGAVRPDAPLSSARIFNGAR